jgi:hypothetical protein
MRYSAKQKECEKFFIHVILVDVNGCMGDVAASVGFAGGLSPPCSTMRCSLLFIELHRPCILLFCSRSHSQKLHHRLYFELGHKPKAT